MKEDRVLAEKIRGAGGLKVCFGSDEKLLTMGEQCRIADALLLLDTPPSSIGENDPVFARALLREAFAWGLDLRHKPGCTWASPASNFQKGRSCNCGRDDLKKRLNDFAFHHVERASVSAIGESWVPLAAKRTRETVEHCGHIPWTFEGDPCGGQHIDWMLAELEAGRITGNKAHRWLGWVQAIACEKAGVSLEALKAINKTASARADDRAEKR